MDKALLLKAKIKSSETLKADLDVSKIMGKVNYETQVYQKPSINDVELVGNKTTKDLGIEADINDITPQDIDNIIYGG